LVLGKTELLISGVLVLSVVAAATDLARGRIYNWLTLPGLVLGLGVSLWFGGWTGVLDSLLGVSAGLLLYGWMYGLGVMGGGDVKLLMALGAWGGSRYAFDTALLGVLLGGLMAVIFLFSRGKLGGFLRRMRQSAVSLLVKELEFDAPKIDHKETMPFGVPIAAAAVWSAWGHPIQQLLSFVGGGHPWF
jgi:prepilin peptidase CpaA